MRRRRDRGSRTAAARARWRAGSSRRPSGHVPSENLAHDRALVEWILHGPANLIRLMSLACEQDHIAGTGTIDRPGDGRAAILYSLMTTSSHSRFDIVQDPLGILGAWVVA